MYIVRFEREPGQKGTEVGGKQSLELVLEVLDEGDSYDAALGRLDDYEEKRIAECVHYDPTGAVLRPRLSGYRLDGGSYHAMPAGYGVFFSRSGFRLQDLNGRLSVASCGPVEIEERLFEREVELKRLEQKINSAARRADALRAEVNALKAKLSHWQTDGGENS